MKKGRFSQNLMMKRLALLTFILAALLLSPLPSFADVTLVDYMEYSSDALAQAAYVSSDTGSDVTDPTYASASGYYSSFLPSGAFDDVVGSGEGDRWVSDATTGWLKQDLGAGNEKTITRYTLDSGGGGEVAKNWTFEGSNDDSAWDILDTQTNENPSSKTTYTFSNTTAYRYYKIDVTAINSGSYLSIWEMEMFEDYPLQCYSESHPELITQDSHSLKVVAKADASSDAALTRTITSPINLSGHTTIKFDIRASRTGQNIKIGIHDSVPSSTITEITPNIKSLNQYQTEEWDISAPPQGTVPDADKDGIDQIIITIINAGEDNTFYIDNMYAVTNTAPTVAITESVPPWESGDWVISYTLTDADGDSCTGYPEYSTDGSNWDNTATTTPSSGTSIGIPEAKTITWHTAAVTDLPNTEDSTVYFRLRAHDGTEYGAWNYMDNTATPPGTAFGIDNLAPSIDTGAWSDPGASDYLYPSGINLYFSDGMGSTAVTARLSGTASDGVTGLQKMTFSSEASLLSSPGDDTTPASWSGDYTIKSTSTGLNSPATVTLYDDVGNTATADYNYYEDVTAPDQVTGFSVDDTAITGTTINLDWTAIAEDTGAGFQEYTVYYDIDIGTERGDYASTWDTGDDGLLATLATATTTIDTGLSSGTTYYFRIGAKDKVGNENVLSSEVSAETVGPGDIVINEIAWAGTAADADDEWIELYNNRSCIINLNGWKLYEGTTTLTEIITLSGSIGAGSYYLIERTDDDTVSDVAADMYGTFSGSGLLNDGEKLTLKDADGTVIDTVDCSGGWFKGDNGIADGTGSNDVINPGVKNSMEKKDPTEVGTAGASWADNDGDIKKGTDAGGNALNGTPKGRNSVFVAPAGWWSQATQTEFETDTVRTNLDTAVSPHNVILDDQGWADSETLPETAEKDPEHLLFLTTYNNKLYAATCSPGVIYEYVGTGWTVSKRTTSHWIFTLGTYGSELYAGGGTTLPNPTRHVGTVYRYVDGAWGDFQTPDRQVYALKEFNGSLYVGTGYFPGKIYEWNGTDWTERFALPETSNSCVIDLETYNVPTSQSEIGDIGDVDYKSAMGFKLDDNFTVTAISILLKDQVGSPTGNITIRIETDNAGVPSGTLANANATGTITPTQNAWNKLTFTTPFTLLSNTQYWIHCYLPAQATNNYYKWAMVEKGSYSDGYECWRTNGTWNKRTASDSLFRIHGYPYLSSGTVESYTYDAGAGADYWGTMNWSWNDVQTLAARVQTSATDSGWDLDNASLVTKGGDISSLESVTDGDRYIRWKFYFSTSDTTQTPTLSDVTVNYGTSGEWLEIDFTAAGLTFNQTVASAGNVKLDKSALEGVLKNYEERLYAATGYSGKIYVTPDGINWSVSYDSTESTDVLSLEVYDGKLYAGTGTEGIIYVYDGTTNDYGLGANGWAVSYDSPERKIHTLAIYNNGFTNKLYAGGSDTGKVYVTSDGTSWSQDHDFSENAVYGLNVFNNKLFAATSHYTTPTSKAYELAFAPLGSLVSSAKDAGDAVNWDTISWVEDLSGQGTDLKFQIRTADTEVHLNDAAWGADDGTGTWSSSAFYTHPGQSIVTKPAAGTQWIQYKAIFSSDDGSNTPVLDEVRIIFTP